MENLEKTNMITENNSNEYDHEELITWQTNKVGLQEMKADVLNQKIEVCMHKGDTSTRLATNAVVMRNIFGFLDVKALKQCRCTCKAWKEICLADFRKRVKIELSDYSKSPQYLMKIFPSGTYPTCTSLKFNFLTAHLTTAFCRVLESNVDFVTRLDIGLLKLYNKKGKMDQVFSANALIGPNIKALTIRGAEYNSKYTKMKISIEKVVAVEYLRLAGLQLVLTKGISISPKEIDFNDVKYISREGEKINKVCINDFVEFSKISKIRLDYEYYNWNFHDEELSIRFSNFLKLNTFQIVGIHHVACDWSQVPEIKNIQFKDVGLNSKILTKAVETLKISEIAILHEGELNLPNLKYLTSHTISNLFVFTNCNNLVGVYLKPVLKVQCNLSWLPPSVKKLKLENVTVVGEKCAGLLESLHLFKYPWISIYQTLAKFSTKTLYISLDTTYHDIGTSSVKNSLAITYLLRQRTKILAVGKLEWLDEDHFNKGLLKYYVDEMANYYIFERKHEKAEMSGKRIDGFEFAKLMKAFM